jgi:tRNA (uracil-5-)-methyltransferase TRM9
MVIMDETTINHLLQINEAFYDQFADSFSATRGRVQPGVRQILDALPPDVSLLDVGCGNGTLAQALQKSGFSGRYLGVDISAGLLSGARERMGTTDQGHYEFKQADLADPEWVIMLTGERFDRVVCFAALHHLPGEGLRRRTVQAFAGLLSPAGQVAVSVWQWQNSPRLKKRVLSWSTVGIDAEKLDDGDVLLDWRAGEQVGLRYVHTFTESSLTALAESAGFKVFENFYSDGEPGNLALYQVWGLT